MRGYAGMGYLDIWYARIDVASLEAVMAVSDRARRRLEAIEKARAQRASVRSRGSPRRSTAHRIKDARR